MLIIPAIDLIDGKCARLTQGKFSGEVKIFGDPAGLAKEWENKGARYLHIIDLDGAKNGSLVNLETLRKIMREVKIPVQFGGGIRTLEDADKVFETGVSRIIIGTRAVEDKEFLSRLFGKFGKERIMAAVDVRGDFVYGRGWTEKSKKRLTEYLGELEELGCKRILLTSIEKDGMMEGPNLELLDNATKNTKMGIIVAGGVSTKEDVRTIRNANNVEGIVIGKSLYLEKIKLEEVM